MTNLFVRAPGKVNLSLFLGPPRPDGRHELVTLFESVSLADEISVRTRDALPDAVHCPEPVEPNLVSTALERLREAGWDGPPLELEIVKRIPIAGGMGGGSADAAAAIRIASELRPVAAERVAHIAAQLGADVPSQLTPGLVLGTGAGDLVEPRQPLAQHALVIVPQHQQLSTAKVYAEADRLGLARDQGGLDAALRQLANALAPGERPSNSLLVNDLQSAALSLMPQIAEALTGLADSGADRALVSGSGPTTFGIFWGKDADDRAAASADSLGTAFPGTTTAAPVDAAFAAPRPQL